MKPTNRSAKRASTTVVKVSADPQESAQLRHLGGSNSDDWNNLLANQAIQALWVKNSDVVTRDRQLSATVAALVGIGPKDELEGMLAAQLLAVHNAAMECYRRAMIGEQTFDGRRESLSQANKLSRSYATLLEALNRHRGKGQQKVTVEHVHVHQGGQAIVGAVTRAGGGIPPKSEEQPHAKGNGNAFALGHQTGNAPMSSLRSTDTEGNAMQVSRNG